MHSLHVYDLCSGIYPDLWKEGMTIPIVKCCDPTDPNNYRGVGKVFCQIVNIRITDYLEQNNLIGDEQAGFQKNCRTTDHLFVLKSLIDKYI